ADQRPRQAVHVARRSKEARVSGDAAHRPRVLVVDLAAQHATSPRTALRRRDHVLDRLDAAYAHLREIDERELAQPEWPEQVSVTVAIERHAADRLDCLAEHDEAEIAVDHLRPRRRLQLLALDLLVDPLLRLAAREKVEPRARELRDLLVVRPV